VSDEKGAAARGASIYYKNIIYEGNADYISNQVIFAALAPL
jgi:hypothetical protein